MSMPIVLELLGAGGVRFEHDLAVGPVRVGRATTNSVVLADGAVSSHHAILALLDGRATLTDLRSTNGTQVNGERVARQTHVRDGDVIRLGGGSSLLFGAGSVAQGPSEPDFVVADRTTGLVHTDLSAVPVGSSELALERAEDGSFSALYEGNAVRLELDEVVIVGGHDLVLQLAGLARTTVRSGKTAWPYRVVTSLESGPAARFEDPARGLSYRIRSENRAVLVYVLARAASTQRATHKDAGGWCPDDEIRTGVWGASGHRQGQNNLNVIIRRTRAELASNAFDGLCIQKISGFTRLCVDRVEVQ
jgi:pSer/pThr/pTyr-binding forkhead associated (FHA) protein